VQQLPIFGEVSRLAAIESIFDYTAGNQSPFMMRVWFRVLAQFLSD
jgi:hypothetical protein